MIVKCDAVEKYIFITDSQVVGLWYGEVVQELYALHIPYWCKIELPDALQHKGMTNSEMEIFM